MAQAGNNPLSIKEILNRPDILQKVTKSAFDAVDKDKSGYLEANELKEVMQNVANDIGTKAPTDEEVNDVLKELDTNQDGKISLDEFQVLIKQVLEIMDSGQ